MKNFFAALGLLLLAALMTVGNPASTYADHQGDDIWTLVIVEWDDEGNAALSETYGARDYESYDECLIRGTALHTYIVTFQPRMKAGLYCAHIEDNFDEILEDFIRDMAKYFLPADQEGQKV